MKRSRWFEGVLYAEEQYKQGWELQRCYESPLASHTWCIWVKVGEKEVVSKSSPFLQQDFEFLKGILDYKQHVEDMSL